MIKNKDQEVGILLALTPEFILLAICRYRGSYFHLANENTIFDVLCLGKATNNKRNYRYTSIIYNVAKVFQYVVNKNIYKKKIKHNTNQNKLLTFLYPVVHTLVAKNNNPIMFKSNFYIRSSCT